MSIAFNLGLCGGSVLTSIPLIGTVLGRGSMSDKTEVSFVFASSAYCGLGLLLFLCYLSEESEQRDDPFFTFCKEAGRKLRDAALGASIPFCCAFALERTMAHMLGY